MRIIRIVLLFFAWVFFVLLMMSARELFAQSNGAGLLPPAPQWFDNSGLPLASGWICSYQSGTTTPQNTYTDSTAGTPNNDPLQLDSSGRGAAYLAAGLNYRIAIYANGTGNTCNGQTVGTLIKQFDGIAALAPPAYGLMVTTGGIIQLATSVKVAWGASGAAPYIEGDSDNYMHYVGGSNGTRIYSSALALQEQIDSAGARFGPSASGPIISSGTPVIGTCGTGSITSGSTDFAGEATSTGSTTCAITFSQSFSAAPFCVAIDETTAAALRISAISITTFTVANLTSNDKFMWVCVAR